jgi:hypothetical protein
MTAKKKYWCRCIILLAVCAYFVHTVSLHFPFVFTSVVRVKLFQAFLLSGGFNGRLARGDELVEMEFIEGSGVEEIDIELLEPPTFL